MITFRTLLGNWTWNMCAIINWYTLIKTNIQTFPSENIWKVISSGIREDHQLVLRIDASLYQEAK